MAAQSWQACARMHNHGNAREAGNAILMRRHLASANSARLRRPPLTTHFQVVEEQQLCLRRSTSDGKLMRCRWGKTNVRSGTMWEILVTDGCGRILEKRKAAPQQWAPAAVDATSDRVLISTPLQGEGSRDKQQLLFTELRYASCNSTNPHPGFGVQLLLLLLSRIGCDQLHILVCLTLLRPMPTLFSTRLKHRLENLSAQCPQHLAPQESNSITLVCLFLRIHHLDSCLPLIVLLEILSFLWSRLPTRTSVMRIQVGLQLMGRMDNRDLVHVKQLVDTFAGPHHRMPTDAAAHAAVAHQVLTDAIVALLRYSGCYVASDCSLFTHTSAEQVEERFTYYSLEERGMRSDDTWADGSRVSPESASGASQRDYSNCQVSHLVVTLLVVANLKGNWGFSPIKDAGDVVENLKKLGCIPAGAIQIIGVYCTPCFGQFKMAIKYPKFKYY